MNGPFEDRPNVVPVLGQGLELEVSGYAVEVPDLAPGLEEASHQLAGFLFEIGVVGRIAHRGHIGIGPFDGLGHDVEVLAGLHWHIHSGGGGQLAGPDARGQHHGLGFHPACLGVHPHCPAVFYHYSGHRGALHDASACGPGPLGQGHGGVHRRGDPVSGDEQRAHQIVDVEQRAQLEGLVEFDLPDVHPHRAGHGHAPQQLLPPLVVGRHRDGAWGAVAGGLTGFSLELIEQLGRIGGQTGEAVTGLELADQPRGVPSGAAGELALLDEQYVGDPAAGEVVRDGTADDPASDNDYLSSVAKLSHPTPLGRSSDARFMFAVFCTPWTTPPGAAPALQNCQRIHRRAGAVA